MVERGGSLGEGSCCGSRGVTGVTWRSLEVLWYCCSATERRRYPTFRRTLGAWGQQGAWDTGWLEGRRNKHGSQALSCEQMERKCGRAALEVCRVLPAQRLQERPSHRYFGSFRIFLGHGIRWSERTIGEVKLGATDTGHHRVLPWWCWLLRCSECFEELRWILDSSKLFFGNPFDIGHDGTNQT